MISRKTTTRKILIPDEPRRAALDARGLPVHAGSIAWSNGPLPDAATADLSLDGSDALSLAMP